MSINSTIKLCLAHVKFKGTITKWPVQKQTHRKTQKHVEHQDGTDIQKQIIFCVFSDLPQ